MNIYFILKNGYPNGRASVARTTTYASGFIKQKIYTKILLPVSSERYGTEPINIKKKGTDKNGVPFCYMSGSPLRKKSPVLRKLNDIYGYLQTLKYIIFHAHKNDLIIVYEGGCVWHYVCAVISHMKKAIVAMELNELPYGTAAETPKAVSRRKKMLKYVFPKYDYFFAISEPLKELAQTYSPKSTVIKIPIMVEEDIKAETWPESPLYIFHSGTLLEQKDGILGMLEGFGIAVNKLKKEIYFYLTGNITDSPHAKEIKCIIKKYNIENRVIFLGYLNEETLRRYQKNCYLTIINKYRTQQNKYCFSTKLGEYIAFSRAVITTNVGESNNYLKDGVNAYIVQPNDPQLIANKIITAVENPDYNKTIGENAHLLVKKEFSCNYQTKRILEIINKNLKS